MRSLAPILAFLLVGILLIQVLPATAQEKPEKEPWAGKLADGTVIKEEDLSKILAGHKQWFEPGGKGGQRAELKEADLTEARLQQANLTQAELSRANLTGAYLVEADLSSVNFESELGTLPDISTIATAVNLSSLRFEELPCGLTELREAFKKVGFREQERAITYAIKHAQRLKLWNDEDSSVWNKLESLFNLFMFEITCRYFSFSIS